LRDIDDQDQEILKMLIEDGRCSIKDIAAAVGLSSPSVSERLRRLQERGVIRSFTADIDPRALGYSLQAITRVRPLPGKLHIVRELLQEMPEVIECDKVTGDDCFVVRLVIREIEELDGILERITEKAETSTSIVKSQPVARRSAPLAACQKES